MSPTTLLATLGGQPQVITFTLDLLLAQGEEIQHVYALYPAANAARLQQAWQRLDKEFDQQRYRGHACKLQGVALRHGTVPLSDIRNATEAEATWETVRGLIARLKNENHKLHLCIAGGRRMMGLLVMSAAMLLCDHQDRIWHLYTPDEVRVRADGGAVMHVGPEAGVSLVPVPFAPWGAYFPALRAMAQAPAQAVAEQMGWYGAANDRQCEQVYTRLGERQRQVLQAFAEGLTPQDVAEKLMISLSTVNTHKTTILAECRVAWNLADNERLDYRFIRERFPAYLHRTSAL